MIRADKRGLLARLAAAYVERKLRHSFRALWRRGPLPGPGIVYATHPGFWDGFVLHALLRSAGADGYCLVEERNLQRYPFLRRLGAFSVRPGDPASARESMRHALRLLEAGGTVVVFPQGALRPLRAEPGALQRGVELLARASGAECWPVAIRYAFFEDERPEVLVEIGTPHRAAGGLDTFTRRLAEVSASVLAADTPRGFSAVLRGRPGARERWDAFRARLGAGPALLASGADHPSPETHDG